ncbi:hypothetical protein [Aquipseudomonas alcaligenes]|uniref:Uncharacterized protein n=1 Tax=Aquipseudomonas alcaligenes TaxID=43263 RepID=A0A1N6X837_AQUAC|nr:hypothetical protein [Pseudomonas alcaligenes]SIQ98515.1 hypothetical protein SAMN05878282_11216 [Pseudomonas alcaligenes]
MATRRPFCIVSSNYTAVVAAWEGTAKENRRYLLNRDIIAQLEAEDAEDAMRRWRAINGGERPFPPAEVSA